MPRLTLLAFLLSFFCWISAQISGEVQMNNNFFMRDSARGAFNTPQYNRQLFGADGWMALNYMSDGFQAGVRLDIHNNSNLHAPLQSFSQQGIGRFYITKKIEELTVTGGYFYDQFANGIVFRSFEERALGIDNAIYGLHAKYELNQHIELKGFSGRQKNRFDLFGSYIKGFNINTNYQFGKLYFNPGASWVNRTIDDQAMSTIIAGINSQPFDSRFSPVNNVYVYSYNHGLNWKNWSWDMEIGEKTSEALFVVDSDGQRFENRAGNVMYHSLTWSKRKLKLGKLKLKGIGITGQFKRTENFSFRVNPTETGLRGVINYLPPLTRQNAYRLPARYAAQSLELSEVAKQLDVVFKLNNKVSGLFNTSHVTNLDGNLMFREFYGELKWKWKKKKITVKPGAQYLQLDQQTYGLKGEGLLTSIVPFVEVSKKLKKRSSIRGEYSVMMTEEDFGSWQWWLVEYTHKSKLSFSVSDMFNFEPTRTSALHYPTVFASYSKKANRYTLAYVKQVEGIVCTGGVCRYEPAFSGVRFTLNTTF